MILAAHVAFDLLFVAHLMAAVATVVVLVTLRTGAAQARSSDDAAALRPRFPNRTDWAARLLHLVPLTGAACVATGPRGDSITHLWVLVGLGLYGVAAAVLEGQALPAERSLARALGADADHRPAATRLLTRLDGVLALIGVAFVVMLVRPVG